MIFEGSKPDPTVEERLLALEDLVRFMAVSTRLTIMMPTGMLNEHGQPLGRQVQGSMLDFYVKAKAEGANGLEDLVHKFNGANR